MIVSFSSCVIWLRIESTRFSRSVFDGVACARQNCAIKTRTIPTANLRLLIWAPRAEIYDDLGCYQPAHALWPKLNWAFDTINEKESPTQARADYLPREQFATALF